MGKILPVLNLTWTQLYFQPKVAMLSSVPMPLLLAQGDDVTVDVECSNFDDAGDDTTFKWSAEVDGKTAMVAVTDKRDRAFVTISAIALGASMVRIVLQTMAGMPGRAALPAIVVSTIGVAPETPGGMADQGGIANLTDLEQDMRILLNAWVVAALTGVQTFFDGALSDAVDDLSSGSWETFLTSLLGNVIWATASFTSGGAAFAISLAGISVGAAGSLPSPSKSAIPAIAEIGRKYIASIAAALDPQLRSKAALLLEKTPGVTRYKALALFAAASFVPGEVKVDKSFKTGPIVNFGVTAGRFNSYASAKLAKIVEVERQKKFEQKLKDFGHAGENG